MNNVKNKEDHYYLLFNYKHAYCKLSISNAPKFPNCCSKDFSTFNVDNFNRIDCT